MFVDHEALLYLVNKPCAIERTVRWFVILLEFDFEIAIKEGTMHQRADNLSQITLEEPLNGVLDDQPNSTLFQIEWIPRWRENLGEFLATIILDHISTNRKNRDMIYQSASLLLIVERLYKLSLQGILHLCVDPENYVDILASTHIRIGGLHFSRQ